MNLRIFLILSVSLFVVPSFAQTAKSNLPPPVQQIVASKPLRIGNLEFRTVTERKWSVWLHPDGPCPIEMQLMITNLGDEEVVFPTFDTFSLSLLDADGKRLAPHVGRDGTLITRPIVIPAHASFALVRSAVLTPTKEGMEFQYRDGTGMGSFWKLETGSYQVCFRVAYKAGNHSDISLTPAPNVWHGEGATEPVSITYEAPAQKKGE